MTQQAWLYDEDNGRMMCRCPECEGRLTIDVYDYWNPYHFCPYCGTWLEEGSFVRRKCVIYGDDPEKVIRVRKEYRHENC